MADVWYTAVDAARWENYRRFELLFEGRHEEAFLVRPAEARRMQRYLTANLAGIISKTCADILFGETPRFHVVDATAQAALDALVSRSDLRLVGYEASLAASFRGDAVLSVRWTPQGARIEEVSAAIFVPDIDPDNVRGLRGATLGWSRIHGEETLLRRDVHTPGRVRRLLHRADPLTLQPEEELPLSALYGDHAPLAEEETGVDAIPLIHIPNYRTGSRFWGYSDYLGLESLFAALNERLSQVSEVLRKHASPRLAVPLDFIRPDGTVALEDLEIIPFDPQTRPRPEYLTWDAHLTAAFTEIDRLTDLALLTSETAPSLFGIDKFGVAESGRALKYRLLRTLAKVARKRAYFTAGLTQALYHAQCLEVKHGARYTPEMPTIDWPDGLPNDARESAEIEAMLLQCGATSLNGTLHRLHPDWTGEQVTVEERLIGSGRK